MSKIIIILYRVMIWHWLSLRHVFLNERKKMKIIIIIVEAENCMLYVRSQLIIIKSYMYYHFVYRTHVICQNLIIIIYVKNEKKSKNKFAKILRVFETKRNKNKTYKIENWRGIRRKNTENIFSQQTSNSRQVEEVVSQWNPLHLKRLYTQVDRCC